MITYSYGNILRDAREQALVVPVNTEGVAGAGLAKQFADMYPYWDMNYHNWCIQRLAAPGRVHVYSRMEHPNYIISFVTKDEWRNPSDLCYIKLGLRALIEAVKKYEIESVALPWLGCGLGGLAMSEVQKLFEEYLSPLEELYVVYTL